MNHLISKMKVWYQNLNPLLNDVKGLKPLFFFFILSQHSAKHWDIFLVHQYRAFDSYNPGKNYVDWPHGRWKFIFLRPFQAIMLVPHPPFQCCTTQWISRKLFCLYSNNIGWGSGGRMPMLGRHPGNFRFAIKHALSTIIFARIVCSWMQLLQTELRSQENAVEH